MVGVGAPYYFGSCVLSDNPNRVCLYDMVNNSLTTFGGAPMSTVILNAALIDERFSVNRDDYMRALASSGQPLWSQIHISCSKLELLNLFTLKVNNKLECDYMTIQFFREVSVKILRYDRVNYDKNFRLFEGYLLVRIQNDSIYLKYFLSYQGSKFKYGSLPDQIFKYLDQMEPYQHNREPGHVGLEQLWSNADIYAGANDNPRNRQIYMLVESLRFNKPLLYASALEARHNNSNSDLHLRLRARAVQIGQNLNNVKMLGANNANFNNSNSLNVRR